MREANLQANDQGRRSYLTKVQSLLEELYPDKELSRQIVIRAGVPSGRIRFDRASATNWFNILEESERLGRTLAILTIAQEQYPNRPEWSELLRLVSAPTSGRQLSTADAVSQTPLRVRRLVLGVAAAGVATVLVYYYASLDPYPRSPGVYLAVAGHAGAVVNDQDVFEIPGQPADPDCAMSVRDVIGARLRSNMNRYRQLCADDIE